MNKPLVLVVEDDTPGAQFNHDDAENSRIQISLGSKRRKRRAGGAVA